QDNGRTPNAGSETQFTLFQPAGLAPQGDGSGGLATGPSAPVPQLANPLNGAAAANIALTPDGRISGTPSPQRLFGTTYRYFLTPKDGSKPLFAAGQLSVEFVAGSWQLQVGTAGPQQAGKAFAGFTLATGTGAAATTGQVTTGPLRLEGPTVGL